MMSRCYQSINPVDTAIQKSDNHPSVKLIRDNVTLPVMFQLEVFLLMTS